MPFGPYKDFAACENMAKKKGIKSTGAYCAVIEHNITGLWPSEKRSNNMKRKMKKKKKC